MSNMKISAKLRLRLTEYASGAASALAQNGMIEELEDTWVEFCEADGERGWDLHFLHDEDGWSCCAYPIVRAGPKLPDGGQPVNTDLSRWVKLKPEAFASLDEYLKETK